jgi:hypothetical protein
MAPVIMYLMAKLFNCCLVYGNALYIKIMGAKLGSRNFGLINYT